MTVARSGWNNRSDNFAEQQERLLPGNNQRRDDGE